MKPVFIPDHARQKIALRGCTDDQIELAVQTAPWEPAKLGRLECRMNFAFNSYWNGRYFETKQVHAIFVEEESEIVIVTALVYYF